MSLPCEQKDNICKMMDKIGELEVSRARTDTLIESFTESNKDLSKTLQQVEKTMIGIQNSQENSANQMQTMNKKIDKLQENEEKNKIDIRDVLKSSLIKLLIGLLSAYGVYEAVVKVAGK